jgi:hypothetical protein
MTQLNKTLIFLCAAMAVVLAVLLTWPKGPQKETAGAVGEKLIADFDPAKATEMQIVDFSEVTGKTRRFEIKQQEYKGKKVWLIAGKDNYPADAKDQVGNAASSLMGLEIRGFKGDTMADREIYGVIDPDEAKEGEQGVGTKVTLRDKPDNALVSLIIGKEVPDSKNLRYVRITGQNPIYAVELNAANLTGRFSRWIEKDLLQMKKGNIAQILIRDHSIVNRQLRERDELLLGYNDRKTPHWTLLENKQFNETTSAWDTLKIAEDETLNNAKLDELKSALSNLQIVDVERKPAGLSADLKASDDFIKSNESVEALGKRGYRIAQIAPDVYELYSNNGEIRCSMEDGVEYILRFGSTALDFETPDEGVKEGKEGEENPAEKKGPGVNRYLFVTAKFDPNIIPQPDYLPLPGDEKPATDEAKQPADEKDTAPQEEKKPIDAKPTSYADQKPADDKPADAPMPPEAAKNSAGEPPAKVAPAADLTQPDKNPVALPTDPKKLEEARKLVEKENQRKKDDYEQKVEAGKKRAEQLNARFADWFYIISDETYQKIHLGRESILMKKSDKPKDGPGEEGDLPPGMGMPGGFPMPGG